MKKFNTISIRKNSISPCKKTFKPNELSSATHTSCSPVTYKLLITIPLILKDQKQNKLFHVSIEQFFSSNVYLTKFTS